MTYTREQLLEAADVLDAAHDVILAKGWWPDRTIPPSIRGKHGEMCMEAAVVHVLSGEDVHSASTFEWPWDDESRCMERWLKALLHQRGINYTWNDEYGRTADEVFDRMRTVAKDLREEAGADGLL